MIDTTLDIASAWQRELDDCRWPFPMRATAIGRTDLRAVELLLETFDENRLVVRRTRLSTEGARDDAARNALLEHAVLDLTRTAMGGRP